MTADKKTPREGAGAPFALGVNIDHVATLRNARGCSYPDPYAVVDALEKGGADSITIHLREDRRHIRDDDVVRLVQKGRLPVNLEIAANETMIGLALRHQPRFCCLVPEQREELTTEGGLNMPAIAEDLQRWIVQMREASIQPSLFLDPDPQMIESAAIIRAPVVELHTGQYCNAESTAQKREQLQRLREGARLCREANIICHAGHGLTLDNIAPVAAIEDIVEFNIGHSIIAHALHVGMENAVRAMHQAIRQARASGTSSHGGDA